MFNHNYQFVVHCQKIKGYGIKSLILKVRGHIATTHRGKGVFEPKTQNNIRSEDFCLKFEAKC